MQKLRGLGKNWMHFVYKLDHLFQSTRVSDENSSVTKTFHFPKLISTQDFFCIQHATFKATYWKFNPFRLHFLFFMHLMIYFELNDTEIGSTTTELRKGWNLAWYHHLTHITCAQKLRGFGKNWMHFVYKLDRLFQSTRVSDENASVTKTFHFSKLISTQDFFCIQHATFKGTYWNFNPFWLHLIFFLHLMIYFQLNDPIIGKGYILNSEKVQTWHGIIIWPT